MNPFSNVVSVENLKCMAENILPLLGYGSEMKKYRHITEKDLKYFEYQRGNLFHPPHKNILNDSIFYFLDHYISFIINVSGKWEEKREMADFVACRINMEKNKQGNL